MEAYDPQGMANLDLRDMEDRICLGCGPHGFREVVPIINLLWKLMIPQCMTNLGGLH